MFVGAPVFASDASTFEVEMNLSDCLCVDLVENPVTKPGTPKLSPRRLFHQEVPRPDAHGPARRIRRFQGPRASQPAHGRRHHRSGGV